MSRKSNIKHKISKNNDLEGYKNDGNDYDMDDDVNNVQMMRTQKYFMRSGKSSNNNKNTTYNSRYNNSRTNCIMNSRLHK